MIHIFKLNIEQIKVAIQLYEIKETDIISDKQANMAFELYMGLHNKPNLNKGPDKVKPIVNNVLKNVSPDLFKVPERIIYLTRWVIKILPFIDLLSGVGKLPLNRKIDDFVAYLEEVFTTYLTSFVDIYNKIPQKYNLIQYKDLQNVKMLCGHILLSIKEYYKGYPHKAFLYLEEAIEEYLMPEEYLYKNLIIQDSSINTLYKMRVGTNHTYTSDEMFHIPFNLRGLVSTNRYSIPGLPCVYLGSSPLTCWEELNKPDLNTIQTSLYITKDIRYMDLSTPPGAAINNIISFHSFNGISDRGMKNKYKELISYIVVWPLMAACSIRVKNTNDSFKPEYIISQLLLQWIRQSHFDGICYFSTKVSNYSMDTASFYKNYAFPAQEQKSEGHCSKLREKFIITDAVPWQMFQIYKGSYLAIPNEERVQAEIEFIDGMKLAYYATDFSKLETFLINKLEELQKSK